MNETTMSDDIGSLERRIRFVAFVAGILIGMSLVLVVVAVRLSSWALAVVAFGLMGTATPAFAQLARLRAERRARLDVRR